MFRQLSNFFLLNRQSLRAYSSYPHYAPSETWAHVAPLPSPYQASRSPSFSATTILCVRKGNQVVMAGDGQVTQGSVVCKSNARKVKRLGEEIVAGYAGSAADAIALFERLEAKLEKYPGQVCFLFFLKKKLLFNLFIY